MARKIYNSIGQEVATIYSDREMRTAGYVLLVLLAIPVVLFAVFMQAAAEFINKHGIIISVIYFVLVAAFAFIIYHFSDAKFKFVGIPAFVINYIPFYLYMKSEIPAILVIEEMDKLIFHSVEFLIVTVIVLAVSIFLTAISFVISNGIWHMVISIAALVLGIILFI